MARIRISELLKDGAKFLGQKIEVKGWVRAFRSKRFVQLNDGSCMSNIQGVLDYDNFDEEQLKAISTGAAVCLKGILIESQGSGQVVELQVESFDIIGSADPEAVQKTILQPKKHSLDLLREQAHLRIRHAASFAIHQFFNDRGFNYIHTPILTGSDAEGAGEMFRVSTLDPKNPPLDEDGDVDYGKDFFGKQVNLTVSGQLEAELAALGLGQVYTFGPTFRAENSNTSRHLAEFWMIEPEVAFNDLVDNMDLTEEFLQSVCGYILENCAEDLTFLESARTLSLTDFLKIFAICLSSPRTPASLV